jgi:acyl-CoA thioester hydrolase
VARLHIPTVLRWGDLDAYGHVNNVEILRLLEEARIQALWMPDDESERPASPPTAVLDARLGSATLSIIARTEIEYLTTIEYRRSPLNIEVWIGRLGGADIDVCYEIRSPIGTEPSELFARATTRVVLCDSETMSPRRLSAEERAAWKPYVEPPLVFSRR